MTSQLPLSFSASASYAPEDFIVTESNREAYQWVRKWPNWPSFSLCVHGPAACGKTHLAHVWARAAKAAFVGAAALERFHPSRLPEGVRCFVIQDKSLEIEEEDFLHFYNHVAEMRGFLLLTSQLPPSRMGARLLDLQSRLSAMPAVAMEEPDDALLEAVAAKLFSDRQLKVGREVLEYLRTRTERSFAAIRSAVAALDAAALEKKRNLTLSLAREVLGKETEDEPAGL